PVRGVAYGQGVLRTAHVVPLRRPPVPACDTDLHHTTRSARTDLRTFSGACQRNGRLKLRALSRSARRTGRGGTAPPFRCRIPLRPAPDPRCPCESSAANPRAVGELRRQVPQHPAVAREVRSLLCALRPDSLGCRW